MNWKILIALVSLTLGFYACGGNETHKEGEKTEQHDNAMEHNNEAEHSNNQMEENATQDSSQSAIEEGESTEAVAEAKYQCPMKCEGEDKFYDHPGKCPKCGMDLEPVK